MKKEWFVFKGTRHYGPFSVEEVHVLLSKGEIKDDSLVWKEGNEKWLPLSKVTELAKKEEVVQELLPEIQSNKTENKIEIIAEDDDLPPPIPMDAFWDDHKNNIGKEKPELPINTDEIKNSVLIEDKKSVKINLLIPLIMTLLVGIVSWYFYSQNKMDSMLSIKGLMPIYIERLERVASDNSADFSLVAALSLDGKSIWVSTNHSNEIVSTIRMTSIDNKILGDEKVSILLRGKISNHLGHFDRMIVVNGAKFVPGYYHLEFKGSEFHALNKTFKFLQNFSFFKKLNKEQKYSSEVLIYSGIPREFDKKLEEFKIAESENRLRPLQDKLERLQTMDSLLLQIMQNYLSTIETIKNAKMISAFESKYVKEVSPILQALMLATIDLASKPDLSIMPYKEIVEIGKQIGELPTDMISKTHLIKKLNEKEKEKLKSSFKTREKTIKTTLDLYIKKLEEGIGKINSNQGNAISK